MENRTLPLTIMERSPFDPVRLKLGGWGTIGLGVVLLFQGSGGGIFFGVLLIALGIAASAITHFGKRNWYDIPVNTRMFIVGPAALIGNAVTFVFVGTAVLIFKIIDWVT